MSTTPPTDGPNLSPVGAPPTLRIGPWTAADTGLAPGRLVFAVGDSHGHAPQLAALLDFAADQPADAGARMVFLGDLVDRGPDSRGCLALAAAAAGRFAQVDWLMGNHEQMMLLACDPGGDQEAALSLWLRNGGAQTLTSFGVDPDAPALAMRGAVAAGKALEAAMDLTTRRMLRALAPCVRDGQLLFVHGGLDPHADDPDAFLAQPWRRLPRDGRHWAWMREPFLSWGRPLAPGLLVVHGHTPEDAGPAAGHALQPHRLGLDAGSYRTGRVALGQFEAGRLRVVTAACPPLAPWTHLGQDGG